MTWAWPPRLVTQEGGADYDHNYTDPSETPLHPNTDDYYFCDKTIAGVVYHTQCYHPKEGGGELAFPIASVLATIDDIWDWYSIHLSLDFPNLPAGHNACLSGGCANPQVSVFAQIVGGTLVSSGDGHPLDQDYSTGIAESFQLPVPPYTNFGLLLNPAPSFPVPDVDGNDAGKALFTRAEAEAVPEVKLSFHGLWGYWDASKVTRSPFVALHMSILTYNDVVPYVGPVPGWVTGRLGPRGAVHVGELGVSGRVDP